MIGDSEHADAGRVRAALQVPVMLGALSLLLSATVAFPDTTPPQDVPAVLHDDRLRVVASKLRLLDGMVDASPTARRIEASGADSEAVSLLNEARLSRLRADEHMRRGELDAAEGLLDIGLAAFGKAARDVIDLERQERRERERYRALRGRGTGFVAALARAVAEKGLNLGEHFDQGSFDEQLVRAAELASEGRYREANLYMVPALAALESALARVRHRDTLVRSLHFADAEEAYAHERERNRSHRMLVSLMMAESTLPDAGRDLVEAFLERNEEAHAEAAMLIAQGDPAAATRALERGTEELVRALRLTGLVF